ncbi:MAG: hypothetical protein ACXIVO_13845 [Glycocaulis sp.]
MPHKIARGIRNGVRRTTIHLDLRSPDIEQKIEQLFQDPSAFEAEAEHVTLDELEAMDFEQPS